MDFSFAPAPAGRNQRIKKTARPTKFRAALRCVLCLVFGVQLLAGCAKPPPPAEWRLGKEGETLFYFLVQLEAASSGDMKTFAAAAEKLLELEPSESSYLEMAEFSARQGRLEEARSTARKGLNAFPGSLPLTLIISDAYLQQEKYGDAAEILRSFLEANPGNQDAQQELARVYLVSERYADFDALLRSIPPAKTTPYLHYVKARSLLNRNRLIEGEKELRLVIRDAPEMIDAWVNLGMTLQLLGRNREATGMFRKAVEGEPENLGLWLRLVDAHLRAKRADLALKTVAEAPSSSVFQMEAAMVFIEMKHYAIARKLLQQVRDVPGSPEEVHVYLAALAMENLNNPSEALRELAEIQPQSPLAERALRWRLQILEEAGRIDECVPIAKEYAGKNADKPEFQVIYAQIASIAGQNDSAVAILREAREKWPENPLVAFHLASLLDMLKKPDEALALMEFVVSMEPRNALALNYVGYTLADGGRDLERARDLLARAVAEAPEDPHIADSMAWVLYRLGDFAEAWTAICKSVNLGGDHPVIWEHYGDIAASVGNNAEARKGYANALKLKPENPEAVKAKLQELP